MPHPHGSVISSSGFKAGLVRSGTDFEIYEEYGKVGLDYAFYRERSRYHTKYDSVAGLGGKASLWAMMEGSLGMAKALANEKDKKYTDKPVIYFDGKSFDNILLVPRLM